MIFTEEQILLQKTARDFAENEIRPRLDEILECETYIPRDLYKRMGELGFFGLMVSEKNGGGGKGPVEISIVIEELSKVAPVFGLILLCVAQCATDFEASPVFVEKYLKGTIEGDLIFSSAATAPEGHTNAYEWQPIAKKDGDEWVLNGTKLFVTNSIYTDVQAVFGFNEDHEMMTFLVDGKTPGFTHDAPEVKFGMKGSGGGTCTYKDVRVPDALALNGSGGGEGGYSIAWLMAAAVAVGAAEGALEETIEFTKNRTHAFKPVASIGSVAQLIAELQVKAMAANALLYDAAETFAKPEMLLDGMKKCMAVKVFAPEMAYQITKECIKLHGGYGYSDVKYWHYMPDAIGTMIMDLSTEQVLESLAMAIPLATEFDQHLQG